MHVDTCVVCMCVLCTRRQFKPWIDPAVRVWFFFFKQKTAYEMRISDWSSDVCSSDLTKWRELPESAREAVLYGTGTHAIPLRFEDGQIGRASCRERVCQYV